MQFHDGTGWKIISPDSEVRSVPYAGYAYSATKLGNNAPSDFVLKTGIPTCAAGTFLSWNGSALSCEAVSGASGGTVTNVTSTNAYLTVANNTSTPALTLNVGSAANTVAAGDDPRLSDSRAPNGSAGGDLSNTYPNPKVVKIQGVAVSTTAPASGEFFKYNGSQWLPAVITTSDVSGLATALSGYVTQSYFSNAVASANCAQHQTMYWEAAANSFKCMSINVSLAGDASGTIGAVSVDKIKGTAIDFSVAPTNGQILKFNGTSWVPSADNNAGGTITALTGDVSASGSGSVASAVNSVGGSTAANIHTAELAANAATDANTASTIVKRDASGNFIASNATLNKVILNDSGSNTATLQAPTTISTSYVLKLPTVQGAANQLLSNDGSGNLSWTSLSSVGVTSVAVTSPITNSGTASAPNIGIQQANGSQAGYLSSADWTSFNNKLGTGLNSGQIWVGNGSNAAAAVTPTGDVTISNAGATLVGKIQGTGVASTTPTATNNFFKYNGTNWAPGYIGVADIRSTAAGNAQFFPTTCVASQTLNWESTTDTYICTNIAIGDSQITYASKAAKTFLAAPTAGGVPTFRTIASSDLPTTGADGAYINGGNSFGANASIGLNDSYRLDFKTTGLPRISINNSGQVGVGTINPQRSLHVAQANAAGGNIAPIMVERVNSSGTPSANELTMVQFKLPNSAGTGVVGADFGSTLTDVTPGSEKGALLFRTSANGGSTIPERMRIDSNGYVGIGTSTPEAKLHIAGTDWASSSIYATRFENAGTGAGHWSLKSRGTTIGSYSPVLANDTLASFGGSGYFGTTSADYATAGYFAIGAESNWSAGNTPGYARLVLGKGDGTFFTPLWVASTGNVGIGTTAPAGKLANTDINLGDTGTIAAISGNGVGVGGINWQATSNGYVANLFNSSTAGASNGLQVYTAATDTASYVLNARSNGTSRFVVRADGNVGVGTVAPAAKLDVNGTLKSSNSWSKNTPANTTFTTSGTISSFTMTCNGGPVLIFANFSASNLTSAAWNGTSFYIRVGSATGTVIRGVSNTTHDGGQVGQHMSTVQTLYDCPAGSTTFYLTGTTNAGVTVGVYGIEFSAAELGLR
ncbi:beta strand repeat-containing protein [Bdellovibrio bacteriovorus]|uniref:beta strand repeat-containing protein n=1 Tax=Bdellovibrio bacteriovorus TaxID=959 RepID=UPI0035A8A380